MQYCVKSFHTRISDLSPCSGLFLHFIPCTVFSVAPEVTLLRTRFSTAPRRIFSQGERSYKHKWDPILNQYVRSSKIELSFSINSFAKGEDSHRAHPLLPRCATDTIPIPSIHCALYLSPGSMHRASTSIPTNFVKKPKQFHEQVNPGPSVISF